jgi:hypothetical protein
VRAAYLATALVLTGLAACAAVATGKPPSGTPSATPSAADWSPGVASAKRYARRRAGGVSFSIIGLDRRERGFRARRSAPMASVFKVMLLAAYLRRPAVAHRRLRRGDKGLLAPMIRSSNNVAATRVRDIVGVGAIRRLARRAHMHRFQYNPVWGLSRCSPRDQSRFMLRLDRFIPARHRAYARRQLARIVRSQRWGIGRLRLPGWRLYFKGGWGSGTGAVDHQVAFLESGQRRIALAIFTVGNPSHGYGKQTLQGVAARLLRGLPRGADGRLADE